MQVAVYFRRDEKMGYPFSAGYYPTYLAFSKLCAEEGIDLVVVREGDYLGKGAFSCGWHLGDDGLEDVDGPFTPDVISIRGGDEFPEDVPHKTINRPDFALICSDKFETYRFLGDFMPRTIEAHKVNEQNLEELPGETVVLKPVDAVGGDGIMIVPKGEAISKLATVQRPYLVQEFIDTSAGISGIVDGHHDLRVILFDGKPLLATVRKPPVGSLVSNIAKGGSVTPLDLSVLPEEVLQIVSLVDTVFADYPFRNYTVDFMKGPDRFYVCELNSQPGFPKVHGEKYTETYYHAMIDLYKKAYAASL